MVNNKWTRNQIILLIGLIISIIGIAFNFYSLYQSSKQQVIINQDLNHLKGKIGEFDQLFSINFSTNNLKLTCPVGTEVKSTLITNGGIVGICKNISSK